MFAVCREIMNQIHKCLKCWPVETQSIAFNDKGKHLEFAWESKQGTSVNSAGCGISGKISKNMQKRAPAIFFSPLLHLSHPQALRGLGPW